MNMQDQIEVRLWDYIDGLSSPGERSAVEELIAANIEWQRKYKELLGVHQVMNSSDLDAPSLRFTKNVMEEIARLQLTPATKNYINKNVIRGIGAFFLTMIGGFLAYLLGQFKWSRSSSSGIVHSDKFNTGINTELEKFDWSKVFNSTYTTIFMLITVILGLMLLDMYLQRQKQQHQQKTLR